MARVLEHLLCKPEALSSNPSITQTKQNNNKNKKTHFSLLFKDVSLV
jgi:hypothetical protein